MQWHGCVNTLGGDIVSLTQLISLALCMSWLDLTLVQTLCPNSKRVSGDDGNVLVSFSNFILWRKTWCQHVTCWGLEPSTPEWLGQNIPGNATQSSVQCIFKAFSG